MGGGWRDSRTQSEPSSGENDGEFLLQLLRSRPDTRIQLPDPQVELQHDEISGKIPSRAHYVHSLVDDPAIAAVGRSIPVQSESACGVDLRPLTFQSASSPLQFGLLNHVRTPPCAVNPCNNGFGALGFAHSDSRSVDGKLGFPSGGNSGNQGHKLMFGSFTFEMQNGYSLKDYSLVHGAQKNDPLSKNDVLNGKKVVQNDTGFWRGSQFQSPGENLHYSRQDFRSTTNREPSENFITPARVQPRNHPLGFSRDIENRTYNSPRNVSAGIKFSTSQELNHRISASNNGCDNGGGYSHGNRKIQGRSPTEYTLTEQLDQPGPPSASTLHSVSAFDLEESLTASRDGLDEDDLGEYLINTLVLEDGLNNGTDQKKHQKSREKDARLVGRERRLLTQRQRILRRRMMCRNDINHLNEHFIAIYQCLIPAEEEKAKQKNLLELLEKLVSREWPKARLYVYGSCANSFAVSKSDIDICLAIQDAETDKSEMLLKLAEILHNDNLQNVQALTRARVPIVKLMDPVSGISCDICINNMLAVVNSKLLRDYAKIDVRLQQLAFIVKHWAKSRAVNETYQGTLSSYAYVLMCIHLLQGRRPKILPCLQKMKKTYSVTVEGVECAYFDQVDHLYNFGSSNQETIAQLLWEFFSYWAYHHDYTNDVISIRTGTVISKSGKDWTRRVGNDRHLICIEDPFETSHDLGRVVDKFTIKVLRGEFERAAEIMQYDPDPWVTLFEPYVPVVY